MKPPQLCSVYWSFRMTVATILLHVKQPPKLQEHPQKAFTEAWICLTGVLVGGSVGLSWTHSRACSFLGSAGRC